MKKTTTTTAPKLNLFTKVAEFQPFRRNADNVAEMLTFRNEGLTLTRNELRANFNNIVR